MATKKKVSRRKKLLNYGEAVVGYVFILTLAKKRREKIPSWLVSFNQIKDDVARSIKEQHVTHYRDLSSDAKSFVSRCSGIKNHNRDIGYLTIAHQQLLLAQHEEDRLYQSAIVGPSNEIKKIIDDRHYCKELWARFEELRPVMLEDWYREAERHPQLAFID